MSNEYREFADWQLYERIWAAAIPSFAREMMNEVLRRYEPHADLEKPPAAHAWCLDCDWETSVQPTWRDPDPVPRARKAAAGHLGHGDCEAYDYGRAPA